MKVRMKLFAYQMGGLVFLSSATAWAGYAIPTESELRLLPPFCSNTAIISDVYVGKQSPTGYNAQTKLYLDIYGDDFWHMHHYCFGLTRVIQADRARDPNTTKLRLEDSLGEYDYVIARVRPGSSILYDALTAKGNSLARLNRHDEAIVHFRKAIEIQAKGWRPYAYISDIYESLNQNTDAINVLEEGLAQQPEAKALLRRYRKLGGKKSFAPAVAPAQDPAEEQKSPPATEAPQGEQSIQSEGTSSSKDTHDAVSSDPVAP